MLRLLGIPARVAAGFVPGRYHDDFWEVTDHDAHAWVEVWFRGYGWLPFDPTPGRGRLAGTYSSTSLGFNARSAAEVPRRASCEGGEVFGAVGAVGRHRPRSQTAGIRAPPATCRSASAVPSRPSRRSARRACLFFLFLLASGLAAVIVVLKTARREASVPHA